jgi:diguanylate cyclase (GGDEF)-like protein
VEEAREQLDECIALIARFLTDKSMPEISGSFRLDDGQLGNILNYLRALREALAAFASGDFSRTVPLKGFMGGALKMLQGNLQHLAWQATAVAEGDFSQRVEFMGEFSAAFNTMVERLRDAIETMKRHEEQLSALTANLQKEIATRVEAEAHIRHLAYHDPLTGLANRLLFKDYLEQTIHQAHRSLRQFAVMFLDLDRFKAVNDSLGHLMGDILLQQVGARLETLLRRGDTLARFGGDEFALLLPESGSDSNVAMLASRIIKAFEAPFQLSTREVFSSTSIGIALYPANGTDSYTLIKHADMALYSAKNAGRAAFRFFAEKDEDVLDRLELETALRHSVDRHELRLYYQPQIDSKTGQIFGAEALVRWQHPTRGLISPDKFIPVSEDIGYIETLGRWCLEAACAQLAAWQARKIPVRRVAVNVSARQLRNADFADMVLAIIKQNGIDPNCLEIELTESSMSDDPARIFNFFSKLRGIGVRIAIDDFGTGYSSLSYLSRYPVDVVKIDQSFVQSLSLREDDANNALVKAIALMAHALSMEIVAEGVETDEQRDILTALDVELLQGYLYSRPVPPDILEKLPCAKIQLA